MKNLREFLVEKCQEYYKEYGTPNFHSTDYWLGANDAVMRLLELARERCAMASANELLEFFEEYCKGINKGNKELEEEKREEFVKGYLELCKVNAPFRTGSHAKRWANFLFDYFEPRNK